MAALTPERRALIAEAARYLVQHGQRHSNACRPNQPLPVIPLHTKHPPVSGGRYARREAIQSARSRPVPHIAPSWDDTSRAQPDRRVGIPASGPVHPGPRSTPRHDPERNQPSLGHRAARCSCPCSCPGANPSGAGWGSATDLCRCRRYEPCSSAARPKHSRLLSTAGPLLANAGGCFPRAVSAGNRG